MISVRIGFVYFATIFALAFVLGVARLEISAPRLGSTVAVCLEVPIVLAASWLVTQRLLRARTLDLPQRAGVGGIAFALMMASEILFSTLVRGQTVGQWAAEVATPLGLVGLGGQLGFAALPIFCRSR